MFFLKFFWRNFKEDKTFNWFYVLCLSLGVVGLLLVETFKISIEDKVNANAKSFIAGDMAISSRRAIAEKDQKTISDFFQRHQLQFSNWIETYSLVSKLSPNSELAKLANVNFVSDSFPFYGGIFDENEQLLSRERWQKLHTQRIAYVSQDLAYQLELKNFDKIKIGEATFEVQLIFKKDLFSTFRGFSLAPKLFISTNFIKETELIKFGSTATYNYSIKTPPNKKVDLLKIELWNQLEDKTIKVNGPVESSQQISRSINLLIDYLSLITLLTYLLSLVGIYYFSEHYLSKQIKNYAIYKSMGITNGFIFKSNLFHILFLTILGALLSSVLLIAAESSIEMAFAKFVGETLVFNVTLISFFRVLILALIGGVLALSPLIWGALQIPVSIVFKDLPAEISRINKFYFFPLLIYVVFLAIVLSHSYKLGFIFIGTVFILVLIGALIFRLLTTFLEGIARQFSIVFKHAIFMMSRYFTSSFTIFICLLIGMTLTVFIMQIDQSLRNEFTSSDEKRRPDVFMFDLQDSDYEQFMKIAKENQFNITMMSPMIRARLISINGEKTSERVEAGESNFQTREEQSSNQMRNRGVNLSYRSHLSWSETIVEGQFNGADCKQEICEVSLEQSYARRIKAKLNDLLLFDISGVEIKAKVTSLRSVKWTSFEPNFFILFQPNVINEAPKTYLASFKVINAKEKQMIFKVMAKYFPSVSLLDLSEVVGRVIKVFNLMAQAIKIISILSLMAALIVLMSVSFNHMDIRKKEMSLFFMLGLKKDKIFQIFNWEFICIVLISTLLAICFGSCLTFLVMKYGFSSSAQFLVGEIALTLISIIALLFLIFFLRMKYLLNNLLFFR